MSALHTEGVLAFAEWKPNLSHIAGSSTKPNQEDRWSRSMPLLWPRPLWLRCCFLAQKVPLEGCAEVHFYNLLKAVPSLLWKLRRRQWGHLCITWKETLWSQCLLRVLQIRAGNPISSFLRLMLVKPTQPPPGSTMQASSSVGLFNALWTKRGTVTLQEGALMGVAMQHFHTEWLLCTNFCHIIPQGGCYSSVCQRWKKSH